MRTVRPARAGERAAGRRLRAHYRILQRAVTIESDSAALLEIFEQDYRLFRSDAPDAGPALLVSALSQPGGEVCLEVREASPGGTVVRSRHTLRGAGASSEGAYRALLRELFAALDDFLILHAGVVGRDGAAVLLAGPPGVGKTTLVLELARAGLVFFSDDFCPIGRADGLVHPFPRSAWVVRQETAVREGLRPGKRLVPSREYLPLPEAAQPCRPGLVIILDQGGGPDPLCTLEVSVAPDGRQPLVRELSALGSGLRIEEPRADDAGLRVRYPSGRGLTPKVRRILDRHAPVIDDVYREDAVRPEFDRAPALSPLALHETAFSLLGHLKAPDCRAGAAGRPASPAGLLMELSGLLDGADCHRMTVGRLGEMRELILGLTGLPRRAGSRP